MVAKKTMRLFIAGAMILCLLAGCGPPKVKSSGFLSDYDRLRPAQKEEYVQYWEKPGVNWKRYTKLIIAPVQVRIVPTEPLVELKKGEAEELAARLHAALVKGLHDRYPVVDRPAADVMTIRPALTHLKPVSPALNVASAVLLGVPVDVGEAAVEAQFADSLSGQVLGELTASSRGSIVDITRVWTRWDQVNRAFEIWAQRLRRAMEE
ncbi:MAG: DUF3313 domain-containing protein [Syntrophobacterales bacterium]|nr:DUF3313 domain-containing protein [Syntrophobacterales bacterium]